MRQMILCAIATVLTGFGPASVAHADVELSFYLGSQSAPHSRVTGEYPGGGGSYDALIGFEGRSFQAPPYYGARATWWRNEKLGFAFEFTHAKVYAPNDEKAALGFSDLEFTDGLNIVTVNVTRRWQNQWGKITPYAGGGLGVSLPHVDVDHPASGSQTYGLQLGGPAMRLTAGASYALSDRMSLFSEYQFTASQNDVELDGGGSLSTLAKTNALNFGLSLNF